MTPNLPEFERPPLSEVALGVQFEPLESLRTAQLGLIWQTFRSRFPRTEEQPPLDPVFELFGELGRARPAIRLEFRPAFPLPRLWLLDVPGNELIQIQQDRFVRNWRKQSDADPYPRYSQLRQRFRDDWGAFCKFVESQHWEMRPNQCEVTYVNHILADIPERGLCDLSGVMTMFRAEQPADGLGPPEEAAVEAKFLIADAAGAPAARLHVQATPVTRVEDGARAIQLTLTARGRPRVEAADPVLAFLDLGREAIVRAFASLTTPAMHLQWGRKT